MILPDLNLLIHAYNDASSSHGDAKAWWETLMNGTQPVGLAWVVVLGFVRITTHLRILENPLPVEVACGHARSWLDRPQAAILHPGDRHAEIAFDFLESLGTGGNLTTDAHLAALAVEHQAELHTLDSDFARFPDLCWVNPLTGASSSSDSSES